MSGTLSNIYNNVSFALYMHGKEMIKLQEQAYTGSVINRSSDDPSAAYRVLALNSQQSSLQNYMDNIADVVGTLGISLVVIKGDDDKAGMLSAITDEYVNMTQIISGTYGNTGSDIVIQSINETLEQMVSLANTQHMGQYLFSGSDTNSVPYVAEYTNGEITSVTYQGSSEDLNTQIASGVQSTVFYAGDNLFSLDDRGEPVFSGGTGANAGTGTSNVNGGVWLTVTHDGSNYKLSIDGGVTEVTVPTSGDITNIAVTNSAGQVLYVDATDIDTTGVEMVTVPGTYDVFSVLIDVRDALKNENGLSDEQMKNVHNNSLDSLGEIKNLLIEKEVAIGSKIGFLENFSTTLDDMKFEIESETFALQEADIAQLAIDLSRRQVLYEMSLSVAGKLLSISLLDFIV